MRMSSSSFSERRSSSMSQCVRAGFSTFTSGLDARGAQRLGAAARALPDRRDVGLDRHRDLELVSLRAAVTDLLTSRELDAALVLETLAAEPRATQCALRHRATSRWVADPVCSGESVNDPDRGSVTPLVTTRLARLVHIFNGSGARQFRGFRCHGELGETRLHPIEVPSGCGLSADSDHGRHVVAGLADAALGVDAGQQQAADDEEHDQREDRRPVGVGELAARGRRSGCRTRTCRGPSRGRS